MKQTNVKQLMVPHHRRGAARAATPPQQNAQRRNPMVPGPVRPLIQQVRRDLTRNPERMPNLERILRSMASSADWLTPGLRQGDEGHYRRHEIWRDHEFDFWVGTVVWNPGQRSCIHAHRSWGWVAVLHLERKITRS